MCMMRCWRVKCITVYSLSSVPFIDNLPSQRHSVHDIRLKFKAEGIWSTIHRIHPSDHSSSQIVKIDLFIPDSFSFNRLLRSLLLYSKNPSSRCKYWNYSCRCCHYCRMCLFSCCSCRYFFVIQFQ